MPKEQSHPLHSFFSPFEERARGRASWSVVVVQPESIFFGSSSSPSLNIFLALTYSTIVLYDVN